MNDALLRALDDLSFTTPTPIQRMAIPAALDGRDVLASAPTGSGKSAAFGLPILESFFRNPRKGTRALVLAPTRELAGQIAEAMVTFAKHTGVRIAPVFGGVGFRSQINAFRRGTEIIVATPGRLLDLIEQGEANLKDIDLLVLDEADRMLDMGFLPAVRRIIGKLPADRQTLFFSATLAGASATLAAELTNDPVRVNAMPAPAREGAIRQSVYAVDQSKKSDLLVDLLKDNSIYSAIVFTRTKARAERVARTLQKHNVDAERIHGDRSQAQRSRALELFKKGKFRVLVATDVAARGIDILDLGHVINYDVPGEPADYVHRIGRTARAENTGDAITFVSYEETEQFALIERTLGKQVERIDHPYADTIVTTTLKAPPQIRRRSFSRRRR